MIHFWIIFVRPLPRGGWAAYAAARGGLDVIAYRTRREASPDFKKAADIYGAENARLYKFASPAYIFGASK